MRRAAPALFHSTDVGTFEGEKTVKKLLPEQPVAGRLVPADGLEALGRIVQPLGVAEHQDAARAQTLAEPGDDLLDRRQLEVDHHIAAEQQVDLAGAVVGRRITCLHQVEFADRILYRVDLGNAKGPFTVEVELLYQSIGYRWAENTRAYQATETARFLEYYQEVPNLPVIVSSATAQVDPDR